MKNIVRAFVVVLALTGAVASTQTTSASTRSNTVAVARVSMVPVPTCPPTIRTHAAWASTNPATGRDLLV